MTLLGWLHLGQILHYLETVRFFAAMARTGPRPCVFAVSVVLNIAFIVALLVRSGTESCCTAIHMIKSPKHPPSHVSSAHLPVAKQTLPTVPPPKDIDISSLSEECRNWIQDPTISGFQSQFGQDWFLYHNYFKNAGPGFYVDVGARSPKDLSNTYFFDVCLGWSGLCIEADSQAAATFAGSRTCTVVNTCISDRNETVKYPSNGLPTSAVGEGDVLIECQTLQSVLEEHQVTHVDYMSIDIEGSEIKALTPMDFHPFDVSVITIETFWSNQTISQLLFDRGFVKVTDLGADDVFIRRDFELTLPPKAMEWRDMVHAARDDIQKTSGLCIDGAVRVPAPP